MSSFERVSVVIVSWNSLSVLRGALQPLLGERAPALEIVVVDNDSPDDTAAVVEREFPGVRLIRTGENRGFAGGVNAGLAVTDREYTLLLNPDARLEPDALAELVAYLDAHPAVGICGPTVLDEAGHAHDSAWRFPSLLNLALSATYLYKLLPGSAFFNRERFAGDVAAGAVDAVSGCCFLIRRGVLDAIGPLDDGYFMYVEETDFCLRARRAGFATHFVPGPSVVHVGAVSARTAALRTFLEFRKSMVRYFHKHRGRAAAEAARVLLLTFLAVRWPVWAARALAGSREARDQRILYGHGIRYLASRSIARLLKEPVLPAS